MDRQYYNVICEEISILGGKVIHIDKNVGSLDEVHKLLVKMLTGILMVNGNYIL